MRNNINKKFNQIIIQIIKYYNINKFLIAISGGQDSICMMKLLEKLPKKLQLKIDYIYIDHQWKQNSKQHTENLIQTCKKIKKEIYIYQIKKISSSENTSRIYRYNTLINHAINHKNKAIITAHSQSDKIETFLYNLTRGTGSEGASGLNFHRKLNKKLNIFRPLIKQNRSEIYFFCKRWLLPIWSDNTNYNYNITRNRIRNEIIPYFKKYLNKNFECNITSFLYNIYRDNEYIKQQALKIYLINKNQTYIALQHSNIKKQHLAIQIKVIQLFIYHNFYITINKKILFYLINLIYNTNCSKKIYYKNIQIYINSKWIYIK